MGTIHIPDNGSERDFPDVPSLLVAMDAAARLGAVCFVKWTCECGERAISDEPNVFCTEGFIHTARKDGAACGRIYRGERYGFAMAIPADAPAANLAELQRILRASQAQQRN